MKKSNLSKVALLFSLSLVATPEMVNNFVTLTGDYQHSKMVDEYGPLFLADIHLIDLA